MTLDEAAKVKNTQIAKELVRSFKRSRLGFVHH
jgi:hypothetical protein